MKKANAQPRNGRQGEVRALRERLAQADRGLQEIGRAVDALLIRTALTFGEPIPPEGRVLRLPAFRMDDLLKQFSLRAYKEKETGAYVIQCLPRGEEEGL